jgi:hypothetical protein
MIKAPMMKVEHTLNLDEFLYRIFSQEYNNARRRPNNTTLLGKEAQYKRYSVLDSIFVKPISKYKSLKIKIKNKVYIR